MPEQCIAVTEGGERCSRRAEENGFCHQHGPDDETVEDADDGTDSETGTDAEEDEAQMSENEDTQTADGDETDDAQSDSQNRENADGESTDESEADAEAESQEDAEAESDEDSESQSGGDSSDGEADIVTVRNTVQTDVPNLINHDLDGVTSVIREEDGWMATVEMVERHSVPDTQDILGHYEISLDGDAEIVGYRRLDTYRRAEGPPFEG